CEPTGFGQQEGAPGHEEEERRLQQREVSQPGEFGYQGGHESSRHTEGEGAAEHTQEHAERLEHGGALERVTVVPRGLVRYDRPETHICMHIHKHKNAHKHRQTHIHLNRHTHTYIYTDTHTYNYTDTQLKMSSGHKLCCSSTFNTREQEKEIAVHISLLITQV
ncbi:hypothetical protein ANANG_G00153010, partial [Anguilla anguilla]